MRKQLKYRTFVVINSKTGNTWVIILEEGMSEQKGCPNRSQEYTWQKERDRWGRGRERRDKRSGGAGKSVNCHINDVERSLQLFLQSPGVIMCLPPGRALAVSTRQTRPLAGTLTCGSAAGFGSQAPTPAAIRHQPGGFRGTSSACMRRGTSLGCCPGL